MSKQVNKVPITETYELPSGGKLYGLTDANITLRAMTALDEKKRLASTGMQVIPDLINSCVVSPEKFDAGELKLFDLQFLMYKLRTVTYGSEYKVSYVCPHCGKKVELKVDLDSIPVKYLPDDFSEPFTIGPLPISGDVLECKILSANDFVSIEREAKRLKSKYPDYEGDPEFILSYQYKILRVNGEDVPPYKIQKYVEELHARDMRFLDSKYNEIVDNIGMDLLRVDECPSCGRDIEYNLPVTDEFFRPTY